MPGRRYTVGFFLVQLTLFAAVYAGLFSGPQDFARAHDGAERFLAGCVILYGVLAPVAMIGLWRAAPWTLGVLVPWAVACVVAGTFASGYYAGPGERILAPVAAGAATILLTGLVVWYARRWLARARTTTVEST